MAFYDLLKARNVGSTTDNAPAGLKFKSLTYDDVESAPFFSMSAQKQSLGIETGAGWLGLGVVALPAREPTRQLGRGFAIVGQALLQRFALVDRRCQRMVQGLVGPCPAV